MIGRLLQMEKITIYLNGLIFRFLNIIFIDQFVNILVIAKITQG